MSKTLSDMIRDIYDADPPEKTQLILNHIKKLRKNAKELEEEDIRNNRPLIFASSRNLELVVRALVEKGVDVNVKNFFGMSPFIWLCEGGNTNLVQYLVSRGADISSNEGKDQKSKALGIVLNKAASTTREEKHEKYLEVCDYLLSLCSSLEEAQNYKKELDNLSAKKKNNIVFTTVKDKLDLVLEKYTLHETVAMGAPKEISIPVKPKKI